MGRQGRQVIFSPAVIIATTALVALTCLVSADQMNNLTEIGGGMAATATAESATATAVRTGSHDNTATSGVMPPPTCQAVLDQICASPALASCREIISSKGGKLPLVALKDTDARGDPPAWRCYSPSALDTPGANSNGTARPAYNRTAHSPLYCTTPSLADALANCVRPARLILLENAAMRSGAVCLDGSPAAIYVRVGDPRKWHIHFEGGGK